MLNKVTDFLRRMEDDGELMSAASMFSQADEEVLLGLDCWVDFANSLNVPKDGVDEDGRADDGLQTTKEGHESDASTDGRPTVVSSSDTGTADEIDLPEDEGQGPAEEKEDESAAERINNSDHEELLEVTERRQATEMVLAWLRSIDSRLVGKCAQVCDAAWYNLGETITYKGRPVAHRLPPRAMEAAAQRREDREEGG